MPSHMKKWYENKEFKKIEHFIREETEAFLKLLQYLSKYKTRLGITKKEEPAHKKPAQTTHPIPYGKGTSPLIQNLRQL